MTVFYFIFDSPDVNKLLSHWSIINTSCRNRVHQLWSLILSETNQITVSCISDVCLPPAGHTIDMPFEAVIGWSSSSLQDYLAHIIDQCDLSIHPEQVCALFGNIEDIYEFNRWHNQSHGVHRTDQWNREEGGSTASCSVLRLLLCFSFC